MNEHDETQMGDWMALGPQQGPEGALHAALQRARSTGQRPAWIVRLSGDSFQDLPGMGLSAYAVAMLAVVLLAGVIIGSVVVGGVLAPKPVPSVLAIASAGQSTPASSPAQAAGLVAYMSVESLEPGQSSCVEDAPPSLCSFTRAWLANADGSDARPILADDQGTQTVLGWSENGSRLLVEEGAYLVVTDASGSEQARFTIWDSCKNGFCPDPPPYLCSYPCAGAEDFSLSPDGTRVAFVRAYPDVDNATVVSILDIATGNVTELASTRTTNGSERCWEDPSCQGLDGAPRWSPDGSRLVFARQVMSPTQSESWTGSALFAVDADGGNLARVTQPGTVAFDASWSADGSWLVFTASVYVVNADHTSVTDILHDVFVIGADGSRLQRLTDDGTSARPNWTADGRVAFMRQAGTDASAFESWVMGADGANQAPMGGSLAELSAAGCLQCIYPATDSGMVLFAYWQPAP